MYGGNLRVAPSMPPPLSLDSHDICFFVPLPSTTSVVEKVCTYKTNNDACGHYYWEGGQSDIFSVVYTFGYGVCHNHLKQA